MKPLTQSSSSKLSTQREPQPFILTGKLVSFLKEKHKIKGMTVDVEGMEYRIKLAKPLRNELPHDLPLGQPVQLSGWSELKKKTGELKLEADEIEVLERSALSTAPPSQVEDVSSPQNSLPPPTSEPAPKRTSKIKLRICQKNNCWKKRGGQAACDRLEQRLAERGLLDAVSIKKVGCLDRCKKGPALAVLPGKILYEKFSASDVDPLIDRHIAPSNDR